jgi:hypothetical protein
MKATNPPEQDPLFEGVQIGDAFIVAALAPEKQVVMIE